MNSSDPAESTYYTKFYFFNITNLQDVRQKGAKPVLVKIQVHPPLNRCGVQEELGPYTYRTVDQKYDIAFHWNGSLSYKV